MNRESENRVALGKGEYNGKDRLVEKIVSPDQGTEGAAGSLKRSRQGLGPVARSGGTANHQKQNRKACAQQEKLSFPEVICHTLSQGYSCD